MKKSNFIIKLATALVFAAVLCYLGIYLYSYASDPVTTSIAVSASINESTPVSGIVIRGEEVIKGSYSRIYACAGEGSKVSKNQAVSMVYSSEDALMNAEKINSLQQQIERISLLLDDSSSADNYKKLSTQIHESIYSLSDLTSSGELTNISSLTSEISSLVLSSSNDTYELVVTLNSLERELSDIQRNSFSPSAIISAPRAGIFSSFTDGYEYLSPDAAITMKPDELTSLLSSSKSSSKDGIGKVIYDINWYYSCLLSHDDALKLSIGKSFPLIFGNYYGSTLNMNVEEISAPQNGQCVVTFSCNRAMSDIMTMRKQDADLVFSEISGILVPKSALHLTEDGSTCVYTLSGIQAEQKNVVLLHELEDHYIVENAPGNLSYLQQGDTIISGAKGLYDGKIIK